MQNPKIALTQFVFWGSLEDLENLVNHLVAQSMRYARRCDWESVLLIDRDLCTIKDFLESNLSGQP